MSRNLCQTNCYWCDGEVKIVGSPYHLPDDHFSRPGMLAANADCIACGSHYTAWMGPSTKDKGDNYGARYIDMQLIQQFGFFDLSFRSTFNDEPGKTDVPPFGKSDVDYFIITRDVVG